MPRRKNVMGNRPYVHGRKAPKVGIAPAVCLINPKFSHNIGASIRAASCFNIGQVWFTGNRIQLDGTKRLPREERMKGYNDVDLIQYDYPFDAFPTNVTPVAIEVRDTSENLVDFVHPENALYVFGPEDGSLHKPIVRHCHRFVIIPTKHCVNLSAAVYIVLYDRMLKMNESYAIGIEERRGFYG